MYEPEQAHKERVVITGSSGLIGTALAVRLARNYQVIGLDVVPPRSPEGRASMHHIECDLTDSRKVKDALGEVREAFGEELAGVFHFAAYYDFAGEPSPLYNDLTVEGSRRLIHGLQSFQVERFIFSSSLLVMEPVEEEDEKITENSPLEGEWAYPRSKIRAETVLMNERGRIPLVILRIAGVYDDQGHSIPICQHISRIYEKDLESYFFPGDSTHGQPFVHLEDLVDCLERTLKSRAMLGEEEVFLIAEPTVLSHQDLQNRLGLLIHGEEWPTIRIPKTVAKAGAWAKGTLLEDSPFIKPWMIDLADDHYPVQITTAHNRLGWTPKHTLAETLPKMVDALKASPRGWYDENKIPLPSAMRND